MFKKSLLAAAAAALVLPVAAHAQSWCSHRLVAAGAVDLQRIVKREIALIEQAILEDVSDNDATAIVPPAAVKPAKAEKTSLLAGLTSSGRPSTSVSVKRSVPA